MMSLPTRIVLWEYCLSPHRAPFHRALAARHRHVTVVAQESVPAERRGLGWETPDYGDCEVFVGPSREQWTGLIGDPSRDGVVHVFSPARSFPLIWGAFRSAIERGHQVGLLSEPHDWHGFKGAVRRIRGLVDRARFGGSISHVFAIGHRGVQWYRMCGYDDERIFPFAYFVDAPDLADDPVDVGDGELRIVFVGRLDDGKGVDLLFHALAGLPDSDWSVDIYGDGISAGSLRRLAGGLGIGRRVRFRGVHGNRAVRRLLPGYDLLVLPSRWEGWGAVVNEALMAGVPVVCSSACGAADLVRGNRGSVFATGSADALRRALKARMEVGRTPVDVRRAIRKWSRNIEGGVAADYFLKVLACSAGCRKRPVAPWLADGSFAGEEVR